MNDNFDNDDFTIEQDEQFQLILEHMSDETKRDKTLMLNPKKVFEINDVMKKLKHLLEQNGFDYKLKVESIECFPTQALINLQIESFGVATKDYQMFRDITNTIDAMSMCSLTDGNLEILMTIKNMFIEI